MDSVTLTEINGQQLKTQHVRLFHMGVSSWRTDVIYEGIGSATRTFLLPILCPTVDAGVLNLRCYDSPGTGTLNFLGEPCDMLSDIAGPEDNGIRLTIYPNPARDFLYISLQSPRRVKEGLFCILDARGRLIQAMPPPGPEESLNLSVSGWAEGVYIMQYVAEGKVETPKKKS